MRRLGLAVLLAVFLSAPASADAALSLRTDGTFDTPIFATAPRGATADLYVVQRGGAIRVIHNGTTLAKPFLNVAVNTQGEGGLLSMAFAPDYPTSGLFYVYLTPSGTGRPNAPIEIREYRRSPTDPYQATGGRTVLTIPHDSDDSHYGGTLQFGPDNYLYAGTGDGGPGGNPTGTAQNLNSMLGKILRLDPRQKGAAPYGVPPGNPNAGSPGRELVWSYGLRNPFRFSFDRSTGDMLIGDVGQNRYEEIDRVAAPNAGRGANFGWVTCEGSALYPDGALGSCNIPGVVAPALTYGHSNPNRCAITGGVVSRSPGLEALAGRYLYSDNCEAAIRSRPATQVGGAETTTGLSASAIAAFAEDACGRIHVVSLDGKVSQITDGSDGPCVIQQPVGPPASLPTTRKPVVVLRVKTKIAARQKVLRRRALTIRVRCSAACSLRVTGKLGIKGRRALALRQLKRKRLTGAKTYELAIGRKGRAAIRRGLRGKRRVTVSLAIRARALSTRTLTVRHARVRVVG